MNKIKLNGIFLILVILTSCSGGGKDGKYALEHWSSSNTGEIIFARKMVETWNLNHPGQSVKYQPVPEGQSSEEIILSAVVGKTTPDIYANMWQGSIEFYANAGVLIPLDTLNGFIDFINERCDSLTINEITSSDGHIYQVPWKINPIMTIYNKSYLAGLNLGSLPQTYSEYLSAAKAFKKDNDGDGYIDQWFGDTSVKLVWYQRLFNFYSLYLAASDGASLIKNNKANFNNEYAIGVFRFLQEIYKNNYFTNSELSAGRDPFIDGKIATKFTGPWEIQYLEKFKSEGFEYDFFQMPIPDNHTGPIYTYCDPKSIVIFNTCKEPQLAWEFIETMISKKGDLMFLEITNQLPRRAGLDSIVEYQDFFDANQKLRAFARQSRYVKGIDNCEVITEVMDIISQEYEACVLHNLKSPEKAIADAEKAVNVLLRAK